MKRLLALALYALALFGTVETAEARWVQEPLKWRRINASNVGLATQDTICTTPANAKVDTTTAFDLDAADFPPYPGNFRASATAQDTVTLAKLVFFADSSVASTVVYDASSFVIQANSGDASTGWQTLYTYASLNTSGQKYVEVPIWSSRAATITRDLYIDRTGDFSAFGNQYRVIVTWAGASVAAPKTKCKLVYYRNQ